MPAFDLPLNAGGGAYADGAGSAWAADQPFDGRWGFTRPSPTASTTAPIAGTDDDPLYQAARVGRTEYRFESLPAGVYDVRLLFAEIQGRSPGERVFDVTIEGDERLSLTSHDIAAEVGQLAADEHTFFVRVRDRVRIEFAQRTGDPLVSAIRVRHRPDR